MRPLMRRLDRLLECPAVAGVRADALYAWIFFFAFSNTAAPDLVSWVLAACAMTASRAAQNVGDYVALAAFRFFPPSMPRSSFAEVVLALWESISAQLGSGLRPAFSRVSLTSVSLTRSHAPSSRARR